MSEDLAFVKLYADASGVSHFTDEAIPWQETKSPAASMREWITPLRDAESIGYNRMPSGYVEDWHNCPRLQFVMVMRGALDVEASDGETRRFSPGSVLLAGDITGRGHRSVVVGAEECLLAWVPVPAVGTDLTT